VARVPQLDRRVMQRLPTRDTGWAEHFPGLQRDLVLFERAVGN
jgi:hypothetical protein